MMKFIKNFRNDEDGAVTVDWVVLTAAVVGLAVAAYSSIQSGATSLTTSTSDFLTAQDPRAAAGANIQGAFPEPETPPTTTTPATTTPGG
ncbi:MAG: hypothetical protein ABJ360_05360 [Roseobacter sp.]